MSFKFNPLTGKLDLVNQEDWLLHTELLDSFLPFGNLEDSGFKGKKGQWSWNQKENTILFCLARDTWVNLVTLEKIDNFFNVSSLIENFVPPSLVLNNDSKGKKGQWSVQVGHSSHKGYFKFCIATDTWVRFEVETLF